MDNTQKAIRQNARNNQFGMSAIPYHTHNGSDSPPIHVTSINGLPVAGNMQTTTYDPAGIAQQIVGTTATQTISNKRITRRISTVTQSATPTINTNNEDVVQITGLAQAITSMTTNLTGTPSDCDLIEIQITDNGSARAISWGASFADGGLVSLPTTTVVSTMLRVLLEYQTTASLNKWVCVATA